MQQPRQGCFAEPLPVVSHPRIGSAQDGPQYPARPEFAHFCEACHGVCRGKHIDTIDPASHGVLRMNPAHQGVARGWATVG